MHSILIFIIGFTVSYAATGYIFKHWFNHK
jgi:uncharacterized membrane protein